MEKRTLILSGGRNAVTLVTEDNTLVAMRSSVPVVQALILAIGLLLVIVSPFIVFYLLYALVFPITGSPLFNIILCIIVLIGCIPEVIYCLQVQGMLFSFTARIDMHQRLCLLRNGIINARIPLAEEETISIVPVFPKFRYSYRAWGYVAKLKKGRRIWYWPMIPSTMIGTKYDAYMEAKSIKQFIEEGVPSLHVSLDRWGKEEIKPGVEYIR